MFKKLISAFIVTAMIVSMCSFIGVFAADNVILSQSFESDLGDWTYWGSAEKSKGFISFVTDAKDGKKAVRMADDDSEYGPGVTSQKFSVTVGETYTLEANYKLLSGSLFGLSLRFYNSAGKAIGSDAKTKLTVGTEWKDYKVEAVAPEGAVSAQVILAGNKVNVCEIIVDNVKVYGKGKVGDVAPAPEAPATPSASVVAPVSGNVVFSEDFEGDISSWIYGNDYSKSNVEIVTANGSKVVYAKDDSTESTSGFRSAYIPVNAGQKYTFFADAKAEGGMSMRIYIKYFGSDKKQIESKSFAYGAKEHDWQTYSFEFPAPAGSETCQLWINGTNKELGNAWFDNIKVTTDASSAPEVKEETKLDKINKSSIVLFIGSPNALVNGSKTLIDKSNNKVIADTVDGRTLVPVRFIAENYGAEVGWDDPTQTVTLKLKDKTVTIVLNKNEIDIDGKKITIDVPAQTIQDRTMLPLRAFVEQVMGKTIFWDDRGLIVITDEAILDAAADKATIDTIIGNIK